MQAPNVRVPTPTGVRWPPAQLVLTVCFASSPIPLTFRAGLSSRLLQHPSHGQHTIQNTWTIGISSPGVALSSRVQSGWRALEGAGWVGVGGLIRWGGGLHK